jgi:hypothetical protein
MSDPYLADVGVGQGSALSSVLLLLCLALILKLFSASDIGQQVDVMSYVDDGTLIATLHSSRITLSHSRKLMVGFTMLSLPSAWS